MAGIINSIRQHVNIVIAAIGVAMVGFILSDVIARLPFFAGGGIPTNAGVVAGQEIDIKDFQLRVDREKAIREAVNQQPLDDQGRKGVEDEVWRQLVDERLYKKEYATVGLTVTDEELNDMLVGNNLHPLVRQQFQQSGPMDDNTIRQQMRSFIKSLNKDKKAAVQAQQFALFERQLIDMRIREKFQKLLGAPAFVSKAEARRNLQDERTTASIAYFAVNYGSIADSTAKIDEKDLQNYYNVHKEEYLQRESEVVIRYVLFPIAATKADTQAITQDLLNLKASFRNQTTSAEDSTFAYVNSDVDGRTASVTLHPSELDPATQLRVAGLPVDSIVGPYLEGNSMKVTKLVQRGPDSVMHYKLRHIFMRPKAATAQDSQTVQQQVLQVLSNVGNDKDKFIQAASQISEDPQSKPKGGELGWFRYGSFGAKFDKYLRAANLRPGQIAGPVESEIGYHILYVEEADRTVIRTATISKSLQASDATVRTTERAAEKFLREATDAEVFEKMVEKEGYDLRTSNPISGNRTSISGIPDAKEIVRWALENKRESGEIGPRPFLTEGGFVVTYIYKKLNEGYLPLEEVTERIRPQVINEKKAEMIKAKLATLKYTSFDQLRTLYGPTAISSQSTNITFNGYSIPGIGSEPAVQGAIFGLKLNQVSSPISGLTGVYLIKLTELNAPKPTDAEVDAYRQSQAGAKRNVYTTRVANAIREDAKVKDNRFFFGF
jgi:peptidyl-prolyl cis-trans isomerase D